MSCAALLAAALAAGSTAACNGARDTKANAVGPEVAALVARAGDSVWRVEAAGCGWRSTGSAFAIDARHVVTNQHVIANDSSPEIHARDGQVRKGRVIGSATAPDIAVIEVAADLPGALSWAPTAALQEREPLVVLGYPAPARRFTATSGSIVSFQGGGNSREAAVSDAPIERGNSGGPALRADGSVAGVVTQMSLRTERKERVAIVFTSDGLRASVSRFIAQPAEVRSQCGLGPDFVPPVPPAFDIPSPPPVATQPIDVPIVRPADPPATTTSAAVEPPQGTTAACPTGRPSVEVRYVTATEVPDPPGFWQVTVQGTVKNTSSAAITIRAIDVRIEGQPPRMAKGFPDQETLEPGGGTNWQADDYVESPDEQPTRATAVLSFAWQDSADRGCPTS